MVQVLYTSLQHCTGAVHIFTTLHKYYTHLYNIVQLLYKPLQHGTSTVNTFTALYNSTSTVHRHLYNTAQVLYTPLHCTSTPHTFTTLYKYFTHLYNISQELRMYIHTPWQHCKSYTVIHIFVQVLYTPHENRS